MRGECLCGNVQFEVLVESLGVYQCHCSLCRKQSGSVSNSATILSQAEFRWLKGEAGIARWRKSTGFRSEFCSDCGAPVPNILGETGFVWVPVGLIDGSPQLKVVAHLHTASIASWDPTVLVGHCFDAVPDITELVSVLRTGRSE